MKKSVFFLTALLVLPVAIQAQSVLPQDVLDLIQTSVFEVVTKKVTDDPLTYEKPLPLERLPYAERTDKFNPIGTAFLMKDGNFYTAAHVMQLTHKLLQDEFYIRDVNGTTWPVDQIIKFSTNRDFIVFTAKDFTPAAHAGLEFNKNVPMNTPIFTVGNAQGEGIVIRNGMLTSQTPEDQNGEWKWLRFSAAASPGNSGGPLVDKDGKVIGIITMKNQTENLNYALPLSEIDQVAENTGVVQAPSYYMLPNIDRQKFYHVYKTEMKLPANISAVRTFCWNEMCRQTADFAASQYKQFRYTGEQSFTKTDKSNEIFYTDFSPAFPYIICMEENLKWSAYYPQDVKKFPLDANGSVSYGAMLGMTMAYIKKPDTVKETDLIASPKMYLDYILKATPMTRSVGTESINITSFGEPKATAKHTDCFGRVWLVSTWDIAWTDVSLIAYALPLPNGIFVMYTVQEAAAIYNGWNYDIEYLSDFVMPQYRATIKEWNEYLSVPASLYPRHALLKDAKLSVDTDTTAVVFAPFSFSVSTKAICAGNDADELQIWYGCRPDAKNGIRQELSGLALITSQKTNDYHYLLVNRRPIPPEGVDKQTKDSWQQMHDKVIPYDESPFNDGQNTDCNIIYNVTDTGFDWLSLELQGANRNDDMEAFKTQMKQSLGIK